MPRRHTGRHPTNPKQKNTGEPQVVPGTIGLVYRGSDLAEVIARLTENAVSNGNENNGKNALEGTKFAWREEKGEGGDQTGHVDVTCPYGERLE